jgi:hypothetical protein
MLFVIAGGILVPASASAFDLVSPEEHKASEEAPPQFAPRAIPVPGAPRIDIQAPDVQRRLKTPLDISVKFEPTAPATINPASMRVLYGAFRIDITDRIKKYAQVSEGGMAVSNAQLPKGSHRLYLRIADSSSREGEQEVKIDVE